MFGVDSGCRNWDSKSRAVVDLVWIHGERILAYPYSIVRIQASSDEGCISNPSGVLEFPTARRRRCADVALLVKAEET
jgi:hypothetical protein